MGTDLPASPQAQIAPQGPAYPFLGLTFSGASGPIEQLREFAERKGIKVGSAEIHGGAETVRMKSNLSVVDPAFIAVINEAQSGRLGTPFGMARLDHWFGLDSGKLGEQCLPPQTPRR